MRLIDADELLDNIEDMWCDDCSLCGNNCRLAELRNMISTYQTAYDVDKVVEQLEEERELSYADFDRYVEEVSPCLDAEYDDFFHRGLERAVRIVKGGGADVD